MKSVVEMILKKRDGREYSPDELQTWLKGYLSGLVSEAQMSAWLMAVFFRGMSKSERSAWTQAMWRSGQCIARTSRENYWIDKHSTGGVGDKTSLLLVPLVIAVCQRRLGLGAVKIPMVSGRGLGFSGGTLDKLESVPGFSSQLSLDQALSQLGSNDFFMMGQTEMLAPADRRIYALRDVTGTVECLPLIVSSILSKKLSENLDGIVFDVKWGPGAFMKTKNEALDLAKALVEESQGQGLQAQAVLTSMEEPLGTTIGNFIEVEECDDFFKGRKRDPGLAQVTLELAGRMVYLAGRGRFNLREAGLMCQDELDRPVVQELYRKMFQLQGGDWKQFQVKRETWRALCERSEVRARKSGVLAGVNPLSLAHLVHRLGGGRSHPTDRIDPYVGIELYKKKGDQVAEGEVLAQLFYSKAKSDHSPQSIAHDFESAFEIVDGFGAPTSWIGEVIE